MAHTRSFRETVAARAQHDTAFRVALFEEALQAIFDGRPEEAKGLLRDCINGTIGFEALSQEAHIPVKSLMRMVGPKGNPTLHNFAVVLRSIQSRSGVKCEARVYDPEAHPYANVTGATSSGARIDGEMQGVGD